MSTSQSVLGMRSIITDSTAIIKLKTHFTPSETHLQIGVSVVTCRTPEEFRISGQRFLEGYRHLGNASNTLPETNEV